MSNSVPPEAELILRKLEAGDHDDRAMAKYLRGGWRVCLERAPQGHHKPPSGPTYQEELDTVRRDARTGERLRRGIPEGLLAAIEAGQDEHGRKLDTIDPIVRLQSSLDGGRRLVVLWGEPGTGKTTTACHWLARQRDGLYTAWRPLLDHNLKWSPDRAETLAYRKTPALVVDDVLRGHYTPEEWARWEEYLVERHHDRLTTVITTMEQPRTMAAKSSAFIKSRLLEIGALIPCREVLRLQRET